MDTSKNIYHIAFCVSDNYVPYACVTAKSIIETNKGLTFHFHIISDQISKEGEYKLKETVGSTANLSIHLVNDNKFDQFITKRWSKHAWYRVLLPEILPNIDRILYLDCDIVVNDSLKPLLDINLKDMSLAGVLDCEVANPNILEKRGFKTNSDYICSGVLLMNLDYWREHHISKKIFEFATTHINLLQCPDQDAINHVCLDTKVILPLKYDFTLAMMERDYFYENYFEQLEEAIIAPAIIHYCSGVTPWTVETYHPYASIWRKYNKMLKQPIKLKYITQGLNRFKVQIWNLIHEDRSKTNLNNFKQKLERFRVTNE